MKAAPSWKAAAKDAWRTGFWGVVIYAGVIALGRVFEHRETAALGVQFVFAEFALSKLGVMWSGPEKESEGVRWLPSGVVRRALQGAGYGMTAVAAIVAVGWITHHLSRAQTSPAFASIVLGLLISAVTTARDELLFRGLPLRVVRDVRARYGSRSVLPTLAMLGVVGICVSVGTEEKHGIAIAMSALMGVAFGALWLRDQGAWLAWGAHFAFTFATGTLLRGGLVDLRSTSKEDMLTSLPTLTVSLFFAAFATWSIVFHPNVNPVPKASA